MARIVRPVLGALVLVASFPPASAAGEVVISGTVRDVRGAPVAGAQVASNPRAAFSDATGAYSLEVPANSSWWLQVTKTGFDTVIRQVSYAEAGAPVDFSLLFRMRYTDVTPRAAPGGAPSSRTAVVWAANPPGSCARFRDLASGSEIALSPGTAPEQGTVAWTAPFVVPAERPDGAYQAEGELYDCATLQLLGTTTTRTYHVDSVAPMVAGVSPGDGATVNEPDVVFSAAASDAGAGLAQQPVTFWLRDATAGTGFTWVQTWISSVGRWYSVRTSLVEGHSYVLRVRAKDLAGNEAIAESAFTAGPPAVHPETTLTAPYLGGTICGVIVCTPDPLAMAGRLDVFTVDRLGREWALIERSLNVTGPGLLTVWADIPEAAGTGATLCVQVSGNAPESGAGCRPVSPGLLGGVYKVWPGTTPLIQVWLSRQGTGEARAYAQVASIRYSWRP